MHIVQAKQTNKQSHKYQATPSHYNGKRLMRQRKRSTKILHVCVFNITNYLFPSSDLCAILTIILGEPFVLGYGILFYHWSVYHTSVIRRLSGWRSVNALASHRCDPGSIPGVGM